MVAIDAENLNQRAIYLLRHGQPSLAPGGKRYVGWCDPSLSPAGIRQAEQWRDYFSDIALTSFYSSDLQRSHQFARIIAQGHGLEVLPLTALREIHLGAWEGLTFEEARRQDPEGFERRGQDPVHFRPPGGESFDDLHDRVMPAFARLLDQAEGNILIVGHAGVNRAILCHLLGMPLAHLFRLGQNYAGLNIIQPRPEGHRLLALNWKPFCDTRTREE